MSDTTKTKMVHYKVYKADLDKTQEQFKQKHTEAIRAHDYKKADQLLCAMIILDAIGQGGLGDADALLERMS